MGAHSLTVRVSVLAAAALATALLAVPSGPAAARVTRTIPPLGGARSAHASAAGSGTDLYVDNAPSAGCSDSGSGTQTQPFCTIAAAAALTQPGYTVYVEAAAAYTGTTISVSGAQSAPISFVAVDGYEGVVHVGSGFDISDAQNVVMSGFNVYGRQPFLIDNSSGITITGGSAEGQASLLPAVQVTGTSSDVTISKLAITGAGTDVEIDQGVTGAVVTTNTIVTNPGPGVLVTNAPGTDIVSNTLVTYCHDGVEVTGTSPGAYLENNIVETGAAPVTAPSACAGAADPVAFTVSAGSTAQTVANYNLTDPVSGGPLYSWGGSSYTTLASFTAATGQGADDIAADPYLGSEVGAVQYPFWFPIGNDSPAVDSADANAPGEQPSDQLDNARADDPSVPNTGTGPGYYDRGAIELDNGISFGSLSVQPDPAGGPLDVTLTEAITSSWTTNGPIGTYEYFFADSAQPIVTNASSVSHTFRTAGSSVVNVIESADGFPSTYFGSASYVVVAGADYTPVTPVRILDTRSGIGAAEGAIPPGGDLTLPIGSIGGVSSSDLSSITVNVTVTGPTAAGNLTVFPPGGSASSTSNLNFTAGQTIANLVTVQPANGAVEFQNNSQGTVQVVADLDGYYSGSGSGFQPTVPVRVLDTRSKIGTSVTGPVPHHGVAQLNLSGKVPAGATAADLNLTVTQPKATGFIAAYAGGQPVPSTSSLNFSAGQTIPNQVIVPLSNDVADFYNGSPGSVQLVADLTGYYSPSALDSYVPDGPVRIADTRSGLGANVQPGAVSGHGTLVIDPDTFCTPGGCEPYDQADVLNVTVTQPTAGGFLTVYPYGSSRPATSSVNFSAGQTIANLATTQDQTDMVAIYNGSSGSVQIIVDEEGYFVDQPGADFLGSGTRSGVNRPPG
jgi:hypothetical protein